MVESVLDSFVDLAAWEVSENFHEIPDPSTLSHLQSRQSDGSPSPTSPCLGEAPRTQASLAGQDGQASLGEAPRVASTGEVDVDVEDLGFRRQ